MTRMQWKMKKLQRKIPFNEKTIEWIFCTLMILIVLIIGTPIAYQKINDKIETINNERTYQKMQKRVEIERLNQIKSEQAEKERLKKLEEEKKQKEIEEMKNLEKYYFKKNFKVGDRIKILDLNAVVQEGDKFRHSIGDIDTIEKIDYEKLKMVGASGNTYRYGYEIQKVQSKREWRDLVQMKMNNQLNFYEVKEDE